MSFGGEIRRLPRPFDRDLGAAAVQRLPWLHGDIARLVAGAAGSSPYLDGLLRQEGAWLQVALAADPALGVPGLESSLPDAPEALASALRREKRRVALYVALADLGGVWSLEQVTVALTTFAERATRTALGAALAVEFARGRLPGLAEDTAASDGGLSVLAMGKMGGWELNYSSDIDLILLANEERFAEGSWQDARPALLRAARRMVALLQDVTAEGYVFRTDLRLRPDAAVTPLVVGMDAAELYYEGFGRTWERAAYIKARPCAGDLAAGERFLQRLVPFVWRRHLDYPTIQDVQDMRLRIRDHKGLHDGGLDGRDLKLAAGGIREIEFFAQTRQLIAGGRDPGLRQRGTVGALSALAAAGWVDADAAGHLIDDYRAHRELEHRLQMVHDAQTQILPQTDAGWERIACLCGLPVADLRAAIGERIARVSRLTEDFFAPRPTRPTPQLSPMARETVARWSGYPALRSQRAVQIFNRLRPDLLERLQQTGRPDDALLHLDAFLRGLPAGVQIFSLLEANPVLVDLLVDIAATSPALAEYLGRNAGVFDAVIGGDFFRPLPGAAALQAGLSSALAAAVDYEAALNTARRWWKEAHFRIGVHHLRGLTDAEAAGRAYAGLAEATLGALFPVVVADVSARHGPPPGRGATVIAMGSLGSGWLTSGSDLDLIVIYDPLDAETSAGARPLSVRSYYARLTQALVTALSAPMPDGRLYEVDMRLRPSGRQGPVATSLAAFRNYQVNEAWTWEHLALTCARPVAGVAAIGEEVEAFRRELIAAPRERGQLLKDVAAMLARLAARDQAQQAALTADKEGSPPRNGSSWELKTGPGGVQEIELVAQTAALIARSDARDPPSQLAAGASSGWLTDAEARQLSDAWRLQQRLRTALRLLSDRPTAPSALGSGALRLMTREGAGDSPPLGQRAQAAAIIADALSRADIPD